MSSDPRSGLFFRPVRLLERVHNSAQKYPDRSCVQRARRRWGEEADLSEEWTWDNSIHRPTRDSSIATPQRSTSQQPGNARVIGFPPEPTGPRSTAINLINISFHPT